MTTKSILILILLAISMNAKSDDKYERSCAVCHEIGIAGAPVSHDTEVWNERLENGIDILLSSVKNGLNGMPAGGLCFDCSDVDYLKLISYMSTEKE